MASRSLSCDPSRYELPGRPNRYGEQMTLTIDNRDLNEICAYQEDRIEALKRRIKELEDEIREIKACE